MKAFIFAIALALCARASAFGHFHHNPEPATPTPTPMPTPNLSPSSPNDDGSGGDDDDDDGGLWEGPCTVCPAEDVFRKCPSLSMTQCETDPDCTWCTSPAGSSAPQCRVACTCDDPTGTGIQDETTLLYLACRYESGVGTVHVPSWRGCECSLPE